MPILSLIFCLKHYCLGSTVIFRCSFFVMPQSSSGASSSQRRGRGINSRPPPGNSPPTWWLWTPWAPCSRCSIPWTENKTKFIMLQSLRKMNCTVICTGTSMHATATPNQHIVRLLQIVPRSMTSANKNWHPPVMYGYHFVFWLASLSFTSAIAPHALSKVRMDRKYIPHTMWNLQQMQSK